MGRQIESTSSGSSEDSVTSKTEGLPSMTGPDDRQKEDWSYYYALYHMLTHWGAFVAIFVLLVTIGVLWNSVQSPRVAHPMFATLGLAVLCVVELYLLRCIYKESAYLLRKLPIAERPAELIEWLLHKHPTEHFWGIAVGVLAFTGCDIYMAFNR
jgi:hypothetical protein